MANAKLHVLYIPGLGDEKVRGQKFAVHMWRLWGVESEVLVAQWANDEAWDAKYTRLLARVDELIAENKNVAVIGTSAGASAAINVYAARKSQLVGCVVIAGKINNAAAIGERYRRKHPAFVQSVEICEKALQGLSDSDRRRIMSRYALFDGLIPRRDSYIAGAQNRVAPSMGHAFTIATQITIGAPLFLHFLKVLAQKKR